MNDCAVGIDVSKLKLDVCVVDGTKGDARFKYKVVKNTRSGHAELIAWLLQRHLPSDVPVVLEATGPYSEAGLDPISWTPSLGCLGLFQLIQFVLHRAFVAERRMPSHSIVPHFDVFEQG